MAFECYVKQSKHPSSGTPILLVRKDKHDELKEWADDVEELKCTLKRAKKRSTRSLTQLNKYWVIMAFIADSAPEAYVFSICGRTSLTKEEWHTHICMCLNVKSIAFDKMEQWEMDNHMNNAIEFAAGRVFECTVEEFMEIGVNNMIDPIQAREMER